MIDYEKVEEGFKNFLSNYNQNDKNIKLKIKHSYYVADLGSKIAKMLELNDEDRVLIKTIGLLHDLGRFIQYEKSKMYNDYKSGIDHGTLGSEYISTHLSDFKIDIKYKDIITKSIYNHNKLEIEKLKDKEYLMARLIRDIDKIDILRVEASFERVFDKPTPKVLKDFYNKKLINSKDIKNESDEFLQILAFIFDINFKESIDLLLDTDNLDLYLSTVEVKNIKEFNKIKELVIKYIEERVK